MSKKFVIIVSAVAITCLVLGTGIGYLVGKAQDAGTASPTPQPTTTVVTTPTASSTPSAQTKHYSAQLIADPTYKSLSFSYPVSANVKVWQGPKNSQDNTCPIWYVLLSQDESLYMHISLCPDEAGSSELLPQKGSFKPFSVSELTHTNGTRFLRLETQGGGMGGSDKDRDYLYVSTKTNVCNEPNRGDQCYDDTASFLESRLVVKLVASAPKGGFTNYDFLNDADAIVQSIQLEQK